MTVPPANPSLDKARSLAAASQWRLTWRRFRRHRLAVICGVVILLFYVVAGFAEFFAVTDPNRPSAQVSLMPPQPIHWFADGSFGPFVNRVERKRDADHHRKRHTIAPHLDKLLQHDGPEAMESEAVHRQE